MINYYLTAFTFGFFILFAIYLLFVFATTKGGANRFFDIWAKKLLWIWLPFYALQRLIKEVILKQK